MCLRAVCGATGKRRSNNAASDGGSVNRDAEDGEGDVCWDRDASVESDEDAGRDRFAESDGSAVGREEAREEPRVTASLSANKRRAEVGEPIPRWEGAFAEAGVVKEPIPVLAREPIPLLRREPILVLMGVAGIEGAAARRTFTGIGDCGKLLFLSSCVVAEEFVLGQGMYGSMSLEYNALTVGASCCVIEVELRRRNKKANE